MCISGNLIIKDVNRVIAALMGSGMKFGIVGYYFSRTRGEYKSALKRVESYVMDLEERCKDIKDLKKGRIRILPHRSEMYGDEEDAWIAGCFLIEKVTSA